jgi:hypothetical protein
MIELKIGNKFSLDFGGGNINNIPYLEIRAIVDDEVIVLLCKKNFKVWYKVIYKEEFDFYNKKDLYKKPYFKK